MVTCELVSAAWELLSKGNVFCRQYSWLLEKTNTHNTKAKSQSNKHNVDK